MTIISRTTRANASAGPVSRPGSQQRTIGGGQRKDPHSLSPTATSALAPSSPLLQEMELAMKKGFLLATLALLAGTSVAHCQVLQGGPAWNYWSDNNYTCPP